MNACPETAEARCPVHAAQAMPLQPACELVVPHHKRLFVAHEPGRAGADALHLSFGEQEIVFDDPAFFDFGRGLARHARFSGHEALAWSAGPDWAALRPLLEQLIEAGLLCPASAWVEPPRAQGEVPSPLPPATATRPRTWAEAEAIGRELAGRPLDPGHLELVVPVYRVAHPMLDTEGRQVGEANVFPAPLRLPIATEWRVCQHAGSRYQDAQPMNVSALRSMVQHWKPAMALLARLRQAYLARFPQAAGPQGMSVGDVQRLSSLVLALPAWLVVRADAPVANGALDAMLAALFRVTDGVRMVVHRMLFTDDNEASRPPSATLDAAEIFAYAERNTAFLSDHGVCAGPKAMIEELLQVLVDGRPAAPAPFGPQVQELLARLDEAFDYGLLGLQAYAVAFSLWPAMARACEALRPLAPEPLRGVLAQRVDYLARHSRVRDESRRRVLEQAYADMYAACGAGLGDGFDAEALPRRLAALDGAQLDRSCRSLQALGWRGHPVAAEVLAGYLAQEQAVVRAAEAVQARLNARIGRPPPRRALTAADLAMHYRLVAYHYDGGELRRAGGRLPYLPDDLLDTLGLQVEVSAGGIVLGRRGGAARGPCGTPASGVAAGAGAP